MSEEVVKPVVKPVVTPTGDPVADPVVKPVEPVVDPIVEPVVKDAVVETVVDPKDEIVSDTVDSKITKVSGLMEQAGLDMKSVAEFSKANGGQLDLDTMVALTTKHGEAVAGLIAEQVKSIYTDRLAESGKRDQAVFDQVKEAFEGITEQTGQETWTELAGWAKNNIPTEERAEINTLLAQGGLATKLAVQELTNKFKAGQGTEQLQDAVLLEGDNVIKSSGGDITKSEYIKQLTVLEKAGHVYGESREMAQLDAKRLKSRDRGI